VLTGQALAAPASRCRLPDAAQPYCFISSLSLRPS
jgi:hypothetical protein